ncbi:MAG: sulfotransferase [Phormidesmis sp. RL_2_1]|nr:sulfotransferase [Phormidesmis sp. RL_2_1]
MTASQQRPAKVQHPLSGSTLRNWLSLSIKNGGISSPYFSKALGVTGMSLLNAPIRLAENLRYGKAIQHTQIDQPPIFILGHWRSGTTYLHRLMVQDPQWGYVSSLQAFLPETFLTMQNLLAANLQKYWPEVRLMDNVSYSPSVPEEEDYSLANVSEFSFYCGWYFPQRMGEIFRQSVLLQNLSESDRQRWQRQYLKILKKATLHAGGKPLVVKNPSNTARIAELLKLFPTAKFVHLYRNPYDVYTSTMRFYKKMLPHYALQTINEAELEDNIFRFYKELMDVFFNTVDLIPPENFVEICYEDLEEGEMACLENIYQSLNLPGFEQAKEKFEVYIAAQATYQKNQYSLDEVTKERVYRHWEDAIVRWATCQKLHAT